MTACATATSRTVVTACWGNRPLGSRKYADARHLQLRRPHRRHTAPTLQCWRGRSGSGLIAMEETEANRRGTEPNGSRRGSEPSDRTRSHRSGATECPAGCRGRRQGCRQCTNLNALARDTPGINGLSREQITRLGIRYVLGSEGGALGRYPHCPSLSIGFPTLTTFALVAVAIGASVSFTAALTGTTARGCGFGTWQTRPVLRRQTQVALMTTF